MFIKLLVHEFRATVRNFLPIYAAMLAAGVVLYFSYFWIQNGWLTAFSMGMLLLTIFALAFVTPILCGFRFYRSLYSEQGYLWFSLPVTRATLMHSKLVMAFFWAIFGAICSWAMFYLLYLIGVDKDFWISHLFTWFLSLNHSSTLFLITAQAILIAMTFVTEVYACIAVSQSTYNQNKLLVGIGLYITFMIISSTVGPLIMGLLIQLPLSLMFQANNPVLNIIDNVLIVTLIGKFIECGIYYAIAWYYCTKKLNLQ